MIDTTVRVALDDAPPQPVAVECPNCFALVISTRLPAHWKALHAEGGE